MLSLSAPAPAALSPVWQSHTGGHVISLAWSPDGTTVAAATADGPIYLLDSASGRRLVTLPGHSGGTSQVAFPPSIHSTAPLLVSCGCDGYITLWNAARGEKIATLEGGASWVERIAFSPTGDFLASSAGKVLRIWDFRANLLPSRPLQAFPAQPSTIADLAWKPGRENILASCAYNGLAFWSVTQPQPIRELPWKGSMLTLAWSPDAKFIATGNQDATIQFWTVATGKELHMWGYRSKIRELAWDPHSRLLASGGSATIVVWNCSGKGPAGTKPILLDFHSQLLTQLAYQTPGQYLASACREGILAVWHPAKSLLPLATAHLGSPLSQLRWSPCDKYLTAGTHDGQLALFSAP